MTPLHTLLLSACLACAAGGLQPAFAQSTPALDVRDADIRVFIQDVARATGLTFIVDPGVQGTVNVRREQPLTEAELIGVLLTILRANGLVAVAAGPDTYRVTADGAAGDSPAGGDALGYATQVFPLRAIDAQAAAETLKPLVGRGGMVVALPQGNRLLVADYADNLQRIAALVAEVDSDQAGIETVTLRNSSAAEIAATVAGLFDTGAQAGGALSVLPVPSSNSIVVRGAPERVQRVVQTILELDRRAEGPGNVQVLPLLHASAEQLLPVLRELVGQPHGDDATGGVPAVATDGTQSQVIGPGTGRRPTIVRAPGQNALVIHADAETQRTLRDVIRQLDVRRRQVLVEAIVVEISDEAASELGAQIAAADRHGMPFGMTQFRGNAPGIAELAGAALIERDGDGDGDGDDTDDDTSGAGDGLADIARRAALESLLGLGGGLAGFGGRAGDTLFGLVINAVKRDTGSNLLSTPSILTLDNEPARILVGQEVPITTGEVLGEANANPFRTIERQNVGIQLEVVPQINDGGGITLQLRQEVSSVAGPVSAGSDELVINKREIETRVLVDDGAIVVLGGLLDQADRRSVDKVPLLGDIPLIGNLFRSTARSDTRTNLMVFIRPTVIAGPDDARRATAPRYDYIRDSQRQLDPDGTREAALDVLVRDYLHAQPPVGDAADAR